MLGEFRALNLLLDLVRDPRYCVRLAVGRLPDLAEELVSRLAALADGIDAALAEQVHLMPRLLDS